MSSGTRISRRPRWMVRTAALRYLPRGRNRWRREASGSPTTTRWSIELGRRLRPGPPASAGLARRPGQSRFGSGSGASFDLPAAEYQGQAVVVDSSHKITMLDPVTGAGHSAGAVAGSTLIAAVEPVVAESIILTVSVAILAATELPTGLGARTAMGDATTRRPPVIAGDVVLWVSLDNRPRW